MKNRELVSEIVNDLRAKNIGDRISERYVLFKLRSANALFLKRENDKLGLPYDSNIWTSIECIDMITTTHTVCADVSVPTGSYVISSQEIPSIYSYRNGPLVRELTPLDGSKLYIFTTPSDYLKILKREFRDKTAKYFWFKGNRIVIPDGPERINLTAAFWDSSQARALNCCADKGFIDPMNEEFPCPPHLLDTVTDKVKDDLFKYYSRKIEDETADLDTNDKTQHKTK